MKKWIVLLILLIPTLSLADAVRLGGIPSRAQMGVDLVDNISAANMPVSTAQAIAINAKVDKTAFNSYSAATQAKLALKASTSHHLTHSVGGTDAIAPGDIGALTPTGSGALLTGVLHSADYEAINVQQRGIKGDGTDEGAAIQSLLNAAEAGDSFYFPEGVYGSSVKITLPQELSIEITGDGPKQTIFKALGSMTSFFYKGGGSTVVEQPEFSDFGIKCNKLAGIGMELQTYKNAKLDRLYIEDYTGDSALLLGKTSGSGGLHMFYEGKINDISTYLNTANWPDQTTRPPYGIHFQSTASDNLVTKVVTAYAKTAGILDGAYGNNKFSQLHPWGTSSYPTPYGIITYGKATISGSEFDTCATAGVKVDATAGQVAITGNLFSNNTPTGVEIYNNTPGVSIAGNAYDSGVVNKYTILGAGIKGVGFTFTDGFDASSLSSATVGLGNLTNDAQLKVSQLVTTIGTTGSDANVPSEKATRSAIAAAVAASGGGNVTGPVSAINGHMAVFSGTDGKTIADGGAIGSGTVTAVTATAPVESSGGTAPVISMAASTDLVNGYLTAADHTAFAAKAPLASPAFTGSPSVAPTLDSNLVTNGTFATDASSWTATGWTWGSGKVTHTTGNTNVLTQSSVSIVAGNTYRITYDISGMTAGTVNVATASGGGITHIVITANVTGFSYVFTAASNTSLGFSPSSTFDGAIDNVSLVQVTGGNFASGDGFSISNDGYNVGVGTSTPAAPFEIFSDGARPGIAMVTTYSGGDNTNQSPSFIGRGARGTPSAPIQSKTNDQLAGMAARGHDGTAFSAFTKGVFGIYAGENWTPSAQGTYLGFQTTANGTTTRNEKFRIGDGGLLTEGIVATTASATVTNSVTKITLATGTATITLPATLPAGSTSASMVVLGAAASGVSIAAGSGGSVTWGDAGAPTFTNSKRQRVTCVSDNTAATTTAAWDCYLAGGTF